jgi:hypothetical protein
MFFAVDRLVREQVQDARIVGFLSRRSKPSRETERASDAYSESIESGGFGTAPSLCLLPFCVHAELDPARRNRSTAGSASPP